MTSQIQPIELALRSRPGLLFRFRLNVRYRKEFDVAKQNPWKVAEVYSKLGSYHCENADRSWPLRELFDRMDIASRHLMAQVELSRANLFLTTDPLRKDLAYCLGLSSELV